MIKVLRLTVLSAFLFFVAVNSTNAAFPKDKDNAATVSTVITPLSAELKEKPISKSELKKELSSLKKENKHFMGGGKSKIVAALLAFFLGGLGIHSFYMGQKQKGFIQLGGYVVGIILVIIGAAQAVNTVNPTTGAITKGSTALLILGYLLLFGIAIWAFIDFVRILTGGLAPEEGFDS